MPIIKSYLLPHSPLLIPEIGKANHELLAKTSLAYKNIQDDLKANNIQTLVIISPHTHIQDNHYLINTAPEMNISFQDFGFIPPKTIIKGGIPLADEIKNALKEELPIKFLSETDLDYGSGIPVYLLRGQNENLRVIVTAPAQDLDLEQHIAFGEKLKPILDKNERRIAVIASGDLSHRLTRNAPGGYSSKGPKFDNKVIEYISYPETVIENILKLDTRLIIDANECGLKPLCILMGILKDINWQPDILNYQTDFGVGYLSVEFILKENSETGQNDSGVI